MMDEECREAKITNRDANVGRTLLLLFLLLTVLLGFCDLGRFGFTLTILGLDVLIVDRESLVNLESESGSVIDTVWKDDISLDRKTGLWKCTYRLNNSMLSISRSIPVIFPARFGFISAILGNKFSPRICFWVCGGAARRDWRVRAGGAGAPAS